MAKGKFENEDAILIKALSLNKWMAATNILLRHRFLRAELLEMTVVRHFLKGSHHEDCLVRGLIDNVLLSANGNFSSISSNGLEQLHVVIIRN